MSRKSDISYWCAFLSLLIYGRIRGSKCFPTSAIVTTPVVTTTYSLPVQEFDALKIFYDATGGESWLWKTPYNKLNGYPWNFTLVNNQEQNPCDSNFPWQGLECSTSCKVSPCRVVKIDLANKALVGTVPLSALNAFSLLSSIDLSENDLTGIVPLPSLANLTNLQEIKLGGNQFSGILDSAWFTATTFISLLTLDLHSNQITGMLPMTLGLYQSSLQYFNVKVNYFSGSIPISLYDLTTLQYFQLADNQLVGRINDEDNQNRICQLKSLIYLELNNNKLSGTLPSCIGNWTQINTLDFGANGITGSIPSTWGAFNASTVGGGMHELQTIRLDVNFLDHSIPESFCQLINLQSIAMNVNNLNGSIPLGIGNLTKVYFMYLATNDLSGSIPYSFQYMRHLEEVSLAVNRLSGPIPNWIGTMTNLLTFYVNNNELSGTIPHSIANLTRLIAVSLFVNRFTGTIPAVLGNLPVCEGIFLFDNQLTGTIPPELGNLTNAYELYLHGNFLTGIIPDSLHNVQQLTILYLFDNLLTGTIPSILGDPFYDSQDYVYHLEIFDCSSNYLEGSIPNSLANVSTFKELITANNQLTGPLPVTLSNIRRLEILFVSANYLSSTIPVAFQQLVDLLELSLYQNLLSGTLDSLTAGDTGEVRLSKLQVLYLDNNTFTGSLQASLIGGYLEILSINNNQLSGSIPDSFFQHGHRLLSVVMAINCFSGTIPSSICNASNLILLSMDGLHSASSCSSRVFPKLPDSGFKNRHGVGGTIPSCLVSSNKMISLSMSGNNLVGSIPNRIVTDSNKSYRYALQTLILCNNALTGSIPSWITLAQEKNDSLSLLTLLDLSFNRLQDDMPMFSDNPNADTQIAKDVALRLQDNRLSGPIPSSLLKIQHINILEGNMMSCDIDRKDLPKSDPNEDSYVCTNATYIALISYMIMIVIIFVVFATKLVSIYLSDTENLKEAESSMGQSEFDGTSCNPLNIKIESQEDKQKELVTEDRGEITSGGDVSTSPINLIFKQLLFLDVNIKSSVKTSTTGTIKNVLRLIHHICRVAGLVSLLILTPYYLGISFTNGGDDATTSVTYLHRYVWNLSGLYLQGWNAVIISLYLIFLLYVGWFALILHDHNRYSIGGTLTASALKSSSSPSNRQISTATVDTIFTTDTTDPSYLSWCSRMFPHRRDMVSYFAFAFIFVVNTIIVLTVNISFVAATVDNRYSVQTISVLSLVLSLFKLAWNLLLTNVTSTHSETFVSTIPRTWFGIEFPIDQMKLTTKTLLFLSIFNNILIPLLAESVASPNCLLYAIEEAPNISVNSARLSCELIATCDISGTECATKIECPKTLTSSATMISFIYSPPFHYSYQCGSSLISAFVPVFIYRALVTGPIESVILSFLYYYRNRLFITNDHGDRAIGVGIMKFLPLLWKHLVFFDTDLEYEGPDITTAALVLKQIRIRMSLNFITDIVIMLSFGTFFPPLNWLLLISIAKHLIKYRLLLFHRFGKVISGKQLLSIDDNNSNNDIVSEIYHDLLEEVRVGLWIVLIVSCFIWGLVFFDIAGNRLGSFDGNRGFGITIVIGSVMVVFPIVLYSISYLTMNLRRKNSRFQHSSPTNNADNNLSFELTERQSHMIQSGSGDL